MNKYIGLDAHSSTCSFCVMDEHGKVYDNVKIATNGRLLREYVRNISGNKKLTFEECELSSWLYEMFKKEDCELLVCNPVENKSYKKAKTDKLDARQLANLLRGNFLTPVYHDGSKREKFRDLMSGYQDLVEDSSRMKNRYKSLFRKEGKRALGQKVYNDESLLGGLGREDFQFIGKHMHHLLKEMEKCRQEYIPEIKKYGKKFKEIRLLMTLPGIKDIQASKIVAQVIDPGRFQNKHKYFSYCGLVRHRQTSGDRNYGDKKIWGNRTLKCVYKMAAQSALKGDNVFRQYYDHLRMSGTGHKNARNAVSRKIAAISLILWKNNVKFKPEMVANGIIE
ncbi:IS110 family transposase [Candidatus Omnitrophota bacterium]